MTDEKELEFATKEDLEEIQKNPALQRVYNAMKAGVTKKFQEWAEKGKSIKALEERIRELEDRLFEWEDWYASTFPEGWNPEAYENQQTQVQQTQTQTTSRGRKAQQDEITIQDLVEAMNRAAAAFEQRLSRLESNQDRLSNAFTLSLDLLEQKFAHPEMDVQKVLKTAMEKGLYDLGTAYEYAYKDELVKKQIEEGIKKGLEEKEAERKKTIVTGSGSVPYLFERPKEAPKSFAEAAQQFLAERAKEGE